MSYYIGELVFNDSKRYKYLLSNNNKFIYEEEIDDNTLKKFKLNNNNCNLLKFIYDKDKNIESIQKVNDNEKNKYIEINWNNFDNNEEKLYINPNIPMKYLKEENCYQILDIIKKFCFKSLLNGRNKCDLLIETNINQINKKFIKQKWYTVKKKFNIHSNINIILIQNGILIKYLSNNNNILYKQLKKTKTSQKNIGVKTKRFKAIFLYINAQTISLIKMEYFNPYMKYNNPYMKIKINVIKIKHQFEVVPGNRAGRYLIDEIGFQYYEMIDIYIDDNNTLSQISKVYFSPSEIKRVNVSIFFKLPFEIQIKLNIIPVFEGNSNALIGVKNQNNESIEYDTSYDGKLMIYRDWFEYCYLNTTGIRFCQHILLDGHSLKKMIVC